MGSDDGLSYLQRLNLTRFDNSSNAKQSWITGRKVDPLHYFDANGAPVLDASLGPYLPTWQTSPVLLSNVVNEDVFVKPNVAPEALACIDSESVVLGRFITGPPGTSSSSDRNTAFFATLQSIAADADVEYQGDPMANLYLPVFDSFNETSRKLVAVVISVIHWQSYFNKILPSNVNGITVVLESTCDGFYTYKINGDVASVVGFGDHHDPNFDHFERTARFELDRLEDGTTSGIKFNREYVCSYNLHVYPSQTFHDEYVTPQPLLITFAVAMVFAFSIIMFLVYDWLVERRQKLVLTKAIQSTAIVSSLFPKNVRDRLLAPGAKEGNQRNLAPNQRLKTFLNNGDQSNDINSQPIADLFPHCTVMFADIAGFTAWSSTREPTQVFILLQTIYQQFDRLANRRRVFKVETIGDSYVAVTGLPEPQPNHAVIMARFAWDVANKIGEVTSDLEVTLGPGTGKLLAHFFQLH